MSEDSSKKRRLDLGIVLRATATVVGVYGVGLIVPVLLLKGLKGMLNVHINLEANTLALSLLYIVSTLSMFGVLVIFMRRTGITRAQLLLKRPRMSDAVYALCGFGVYVIATKFVFTFLQILVPSLNLNQAQDLGFGAVQGLSLVVVFAAIVVCPVVLEEVTFRGFLRHKLEQAYVGSMLTALIVSGLFGLAHLQLNIAIDTFVLSAVMMLVLQERRSLWVTIGMHFTKNTVAFLALFIFKIG